MQIDAKDHLTICNWRVAIKETQQRHNFYRVISISAPQNSSLSCGEPPVRLPSARETLYLEFDDISDAIDSVALRLNNLVLASKKDGIAAMKFLNDGGPMMIHCRAGISRSTAIALGYLLTIYDSQFAVDTLFSLQPNADPNTYILRIMLEINGQSSLYLPLLKKIRDKQATKY